jgi:predicted small metal-binding protein
VHGTSASPVFIFYKDLYDKKGLFRMMSLNCRDLGMDRSFKLTGTNEQEIMRKFITYAENELRMPVLTSDTIFRVQMAIKK